ncbi:MAG: acetyl-CoA carboxylase biotin carboxyl carrier protein [Oscillospiraceae bacterium]|nr:acetyl-CoA carboxylase biotin carboxyl carrier protein [Oscillospiraceae bacterium]
MSDKIYGIELETIEKLADIVKEKDLSEITINEMGKVITIKGKKCPPPPPPPPMGGMMPPPPFAVQGGMPPMPFAPGAEVPEQSVVQGTAVPDGNVVKAPIVGTFYAASAPDKPPFVKVGQQVKKGDVLMIIESMKLMNEVQSDFDGTVTEILVKNGDPVEYDQPIMIIK